MSEPSTNSDDLGLRRFAVLYHSGVEQPHYDFLFETADGSDLVTFRLAQWPVLVGQDATKLRDHRRAYLGYVGTIGGDRGRVDRVDEGVLYVRRAGRAWELRDEAGRTCLRFEPLQGADPGEWYVSLLPLAGA